MDRFSFRAAVHIAQAEFRQWLRSSRIIILFVIDRKASGRERVLAMV